MRITDMAGGKTYSQLSTESLAQPNNTQLAGLVSTVFKGETLRSMLLNAYGWWKVSQITYIISLAAFGLGSVAGLGSVFLFAAGRRNKRGHGPRRPRLRSRTPLVVGAVDAGPKVLIERAVRRSAEHGNGRGKRT